MIINLSPQRRDDVLAVAKLGDILTINGTPFDFSVIPEGATLPASAVDCEFVVGEVERIAGELHLTLLMPVPANATQATNFPAPILNPADGTIVLPIEVIPMPEPIVPMEPLP